MENSFSCNKTLITIENMHVKNHHINSQLKERMDFITLKTLDLNQFLRSYRHPTGNCVPLFSIELHRSRTLKVCYNSSGDEITSAVS